MQQTSGRPGRYHHYKRRPIATQGQQQSLCLLFFFQMAKGVKKSHPIECQIEVGRGLIHQYQKGMNLKKKFLRRRLLEFLQDIYAKKFSG